MYSYFSFFLMYSYSVAQKYKVFRYFRDIDISQCICRHFTMTLMSILSVHNNYYRSYFREINVPHTQTTLSCTLLGPKTTGDHHILFHFQVRERLKIVLGYMRIITIFIILELAQPLKIGFVLILSCKCIIFFLYILFGDVKTHLH